jgi:hypothetical protein
MTGINASAVTQNGVPILWVSACVVWTSVTVVDAELQLSLIFVVASAAKLDVANRGLSTARVRHDVVELEKAAFRASTPTSDERTSTVIALPYSPFDGGRYVAAAGCAGARGRRRARARRQLRLPNGIEQEC